MVNRTANIVFTSNGVQAHIATTALSTAPTNPQESENYYLDDGTNTQSGNPEWLRTTDGGTTYSSLGLKHNYSASAAPTVTDDSDSGYSVGSIWIDTTADTAYIAVDVTVGAAVWDEIGAAGGGSIGGSTGATDNAILRADGTGGSTLQNTGVIINDTDDVSGINSLTSANATGLDIKDQADNTKIARLDVSNITTATTRTYDVPDASGVLLVDTATQTITNKTIDADNNTLSNIGAAEVDDTAHILTVSNESGATASANDIGYIDGNGDYRTTTTEGFVGAWCVVVVGAADGSDIKVQTRGRATVAYTGTAPSDGDYLITSTTAGDALASATMRPEIFAICTAAGGGGTVEVLLLTQSNFVTLSSDNNLLQNNAVSDSDFQSTISGTPTATSVVYGTVTSGDENVITPQNTTEIGKLVLWNTTRGTSRLITATDTGTNTITTVSSTDSWADTDAIEIRSQTVDDGGTDYYMDVDLSQATEIQDANGNLLPIRSIEILLRWDDTGAAQERIAIHPFDTYAGGAQVAYFNEAANVFSGFVQLTIPLIQYRFALRHQASGTGTAGYIFRIAGYRVASP